MLFKVVAQAVLLFGEETWVMTPCIGQALGGSNTCLLDAAPEDIGWELVLSAAGDSDAGSGVRRDGGVCAEEA